jgi:hypothetical protein
MDVASRTSRSDATASALQTEIDQTTDGAPSSAHAKPDADAASREGGTEPDPVAAAIAHVISLAFSRRPLRGAKHWHSTLVASLRGASVEPPSLGRLEKAFSTERAARRRRTEEITGRAVARIGAAIGDREIELVPGEPVGRRPHELAMGALVSQRSDSIGNAYRDYCQASYLAGEESISKEAFVALVHSSPFVEYAPHESMSEWWGRKLARATRT